MAIYFASDVHLGLNYQQASAARIERLFLQWLDEIEGDCEELFLVGDIFDFWFEWRRVVPTGFVRVLGKLAAMSDAGVKIHFFVGNHDLWQRGYFEDELGATVHYEPFMGIRQGKRLFIAHGDDLCGGDFMGRLTVRTFRCRLIQRLFSVIIHPDVAMRFGKWWSGSSRKRHTAGDYSFKGEAEGLIKFAETVADSDYFVFGHRHTPVEYNLKNGATVYILGDWMESPIYARMENGTIILSPTYP
ncbi:UDP-2,3-diacylglucosamine diphosphatase [Mucinivorans hirudinis]|uniref:UDP-2,3-diacylglucosamine diphosphatase n=1 Tax=Mucinivorans hirudinis TaxID=1433126 RepID=A0A060R7S9_9BACT|nr:UDP-2,3-diacylglucosamine diphosphatase [Mucinivorans hirudinis]